LPDWFWRTAHLPAIYEPVSLPYILTRLRTSFAQQALVAMGNGGAAGATFAQRLWTWLGLSAGASRINSPAYLLQYVGAAVPALLALYLVRRAWDRADAKPWVAIAVYVAIFLVMFTLDTEIRYALPAVPLLAVVVARGLKGWCEKPWVLGLVGLVAFGHLGAMAWYVRAQRTLTPGQRAVFAYLRNETPPDARILYPGEVMVLQARRQAVWSQWRNFKTGLSSITGLLAETDPERIRRLLRTNVVTYICIDEQHVYEDHGEIVGFGYPRSFARRLRTLPFLEKVEGPWPGVELWRVKQEAAVQPPTETGGGPRTGDRRVMGTEP
jgi:hypothetical protein